MQTIFSNRALFLMLLCLLWQSGSAQELTIQAGSLTIPNGNTVTVKGSISTTNSGTITNNGTLQTTGDWSHDGTLLYSGTGTLELNGSGAQTLTATTLYNLLLSGSGTKTASGSTTVTNNLTFTGSNTLVSNSASQVILGSSGTLTETAAGYIDGWIQTTRTALQATANNFGGLGLTLTANGAAPGATTVLRGTGSTVVQSGSSNLGIERVYTVTPTSNSGLDATVVFAYRDGELNSLTESTLILFGSADGGTTWSWLGQVSRDAASNTLTMTGINSFGKLTLGSSSSPLPLTWLSFTGTAAQTGNQLQWSTASEQNTSHFEIERSASSSGFQNIGRVGAAGNSSSDRHYDFLDRISTGTFYYRLRQVDRDGRYSYSSTILLARGEDALRLTASVYPNPSTDKIALRFSTAFTRSTKMTLTLLDAGGKALLRREVSIAGGESELPLTGLSGYPKGTYFLQAAISTGERILVQLQH